VLVSVFCVYSPKVISEFFVRIEDVHKGAITGIEVKLAIGAFRAFRAVLDTVLGNETTPFG